MATPASHQRGFKPVLAQMMQSRKTAAFLATVAAAQLTTTLMGWAVWPCPFLHLTGVPCPGCGLSRACAALLRGHWHIAIKMHAFAPVLLVILLLIALAAALPEKFSRRLTRFVAQIEKSTGATAIILTLLIFYWLVRLWYDPTDIPR